LFPARRFATRGSITRGATQRHCLRGTLPLARGIGVVMGCGVFNKAVILAVRGWFHFYFFKRGCVLRKEQGVYCCLNERGSFFFILFCWRGVGFCSGRTFDYRGGRIQRHDFAGVAQRIEKRLVPAPHWCAGPERAGRPSSSRSGPYGRQVGRQSCWAAGSARRRSRRGMWRWRMAGRGPPDLGDGLWYCGGTCEH